MEEKKKNIGPRLVDFVLQPHRGNSMGTEGPVLAPQ